MSGVRLLSGVLVAGCVSLGAASSWAAELPPGPNRDVVVTICGTCHSLAMIADASGYGRQAWNDTIDEMVGYGLRINAEDRAKILDYLATALGPSARKPPAP